MLQYLNAFLGNIDTFVGGFVFTTPDVFADTITLADGNSFPGFSDFRNIFLIISCSIIAIVLAVMGIDIALSESAVQLNSLLFRFFARQGDFSF